MSVACTFTTYQTVGCEHGYIDIRIPTNTKSIEPLTVLFHLQNTITKSVKSNVYCNNTQ